MTHTGLVYDPLYLEHDTGHHVENYTRLVEIMHELRESAVLEKLKLMSPRSATRDEIGLVHEQAYINKVMKFSQRGGGTFGGGNVGSALTYEVALLAAGGVLTAVDAVINKTVENAFVLLRPPGHHAKPNLGMGFCYFNNVAIAARYALNKYKFNRVLVVDWDVHHGNGIQEVFYADPRVLYISIHRRYAYPGTGWTDDLGEGAGIGYNINIPLYKGATDGDYQLALGEILIPVVRDFKPEIILVSAGQDAYLSDPIGGMYMTEAGYACLAAVIRDLAREFSQGRLVGALEGGYDCRGSARCTVAVINQWAQKETAEGYIPRNEATSSNGIKVVAKVKANLARYWPVLIDNK